MSKKRRNAPTKMNEYMSPADWAYANPRKVGILGLRAQGYNSEEIAEKCGIARGTVKNITLKTLVALNANTTPHAVAIAFRLEIIE